MPLCGTSGLSLDVVEPGGQNKAGTLGGLSGEPALSEDVCDQTNNFTKDQDVPIQARREYLAIVWARYQSATRRSEKSALLDEICANTGMHRDSASRIMRLKAEPPKKVLRTRKRAKFYEDLTPHLAHLWKAMGRVGGRKMRAAMLDWLPFYSCVQEAKQRLYKISASEMDRLLKPIRALWRRQTNTGTRSAKNRFKTEVPLKPLGVPPTTTGYIEVDTVAHCGDSLSGHFFWTLTAVDLKSRWTEIRAVWCKDSNLIRQALDDIESMVPFKLFGLYCDCGSEFLNTSVVNGFVKDPRRDEPLTMGRSRPYHKNDQAFVEQKNNTHVRHLLGYGRIGQRSLDGELGRLFDDWCELQNFFTPQVSIRSKERIGSKIKRRHGEPQTPFDRILVSQEVSNRVKNDLIEQKKMLNPFVLRERISQRLSRLHRLLDTEHGRRGRASA